MGFFLPPFVPHVDERIARLGAGVADPSALQVGDIWYRRVAGANQNGRLYVRRRNYGDTADESLSLWTSGDQNTGGGLLMNLLTDYTTSQGSVGTSGGTTTYVFNGASLVATLATSGTTGREFRIANKHTSALTVRCPGGVLINGSGADRTLAQHAALTLVWLNATNAIII